MYFADQWQTPAALAVVAITLLAFLVRIALRRKKSSGACGSGCECSVRPRDSQGRGSGSKTP